MKKLALLFCAVALLLSACDKEEPKPDPGNDNNDYTPTYPSTAEVFYDAVADIDGNNNATGFSALPAGFYPGTQTSYGEYATFWSATESVEDFGCAYDRSLYYGHATVSRDGHHKYGGLSVRCVKD